MIRQLSMIAAVAHIVVSGSCNAVSTSGSYSVEPDDFADGTDLTEILPSVTLTTAGDDNEPFALFEITASDDGMDLAPSGDRVFGHADIPFFNDDRRMRMDFTQPAREVTINFAGGSFGQTEIGRLQVYGAGDVLLDEYVTEPLGAGEAEVMTLTRAAGDIQWAVAFIADGEGEFGRLDDLSFVIGL